MSAWTQLKVSTRRALDTKEKFSMSKFLKDQDSKCTTELIWRSEEYSSERLNEPIGDTFYISIRDCINSDNVQDFLEAFVSQSPYRFMEVTNGVYVY